jgi:hypothetical protein
LEKANPHTLPRPERGSRSPGAAVARPALAVKTQKSESHHDCLSLYYVISQKAIDLAIRNLGFVDRMTDVTCSRLSGTAKAKVTNSKVSKVHGLDRGLDQ